MRDPADIRGSFAGKPLLRATLTVAFVAAVSLQPAAAGGLGWFLGGSSGGASAPAGRVGIPVRTDDSVRQAGPGTRNIVALFGGSREGSDEDTYIRNLHQNTGGTLLRGSYSSQDLVNAMLPGADAQPISNFYGAGHIMLLPRESNTYINPPADGAPNADPRYVGALVTGDVQEGNVVNDNRGTFFNMYDSRMRELGLTPRDVWAPGAQINLKPCYFGTYGREFLDELAARVPEDVTIKSYTQPYNWSNFTQYPLGIRTGTTHLLGDQAEGYLEIRGKLKREPDVPAAPAEPAAPAAPAAPATPVPPVGPMASGANEGDLSLEGDSN